MTLKWNARGLHPHKVEFHFHDFSVVLYILEIFLLDGASSQVERGEMLAGVQDCCENGKLCLMHTIMKQKVLKNS